MIQAVQQKSNEDPSEFWRVWFLDPQAPGNVYMISMTFFGWSPLHLRRKLQCLDEVQGMNSSHMVDIAFKVYHAWETRKLRQITLSLETVPGNHKVRWTQKEKKDPVDINQCTYCKEENHWRKDCSELKRKNRKNRNPCWEILEESELADSRVLGKIPSHFI